MIVCRQCGQQAREGVDFCESCGAYLEWEGEHVDRPAARPAAPAGGTGTGPGPAAGPADRLASPPPAPTRPAGPPPPDPRGGPPAPAAPAAPPRRPDAGPPAPGPAPQFAPRPAGPPPPMPMPAGPAAARDAGGPVTVMCLECGAHNEGDRRFCKRCGSSLDLVALAGRPSRPGGGPVAPAAPEAPPDPGSGLAGPLVPGALAASRSPSPAIPDAPRVAARAPAIPSERGLQPAEATPRPPAMRPASTPPEVAGGPTCSQCGTANPPGRRFCRRCGTQFPVEATPELGPGAPAPRPSWWQRLRARLRGERADEATPTLSARKAYRASLDVRYRVMRVFALIAGVGLIAGSFGLTGVNPMRSGRDLWNKVFPRDKQIGELTAASEPDLNPGEFPPQYAVDGDPDTVWAAEWLLEQGADPAPACAGDATTGGADAALVVTLPEAQKLSMISVQGGFKAGDPDRSTQWQPTRLELRFDDGSCKEIALEDKAGLQQHRLDDRPVTRQVRITIVDAAAPRDQSAPTTKVAIGEVRLFHPR